MMLKSVLVGSVVSFQFDFRLNLIYVSYFFISMISRQSKTAEGGCMLVAEIGDQLCRDAGSPQGVYYSHFWKHRISFGIQMIF